MELGVYDSSLEKKFEGKSFCVEGDKFLKKVRSKEKIETIYVIDKNKTKLTQEYYSFIEKIYMDEETPMVLESAYLSEYSTLYEVLKTKNDLNKKKIILSSCRAVKELEKIGVIIGICIQKM